MLAVDKKAYELIGTDYPGNRAVDVKHPSPTWMIGFIFVISFVGLFGLVALRKVLIHILEPYICYLGTLHLLCLSECIFVFMKGSNLVVPNIRLIN
jgi:Na+/melibiose symporter-like transporter